VALPAWDRDRVRVSDIRKLVQWYNLLVQAGYKEFVVVVEDAEVVTEEAVEEKATAQKTATKKASKK